MEINQDKILQDLKSDLKAAETLKIDQDNLIAKWMREYNGELYGNEGDSNSGKSRIVSKDIKKQSEWQHASLIDPFVSTADAIKCNPVTFEDVKAARQNQILLNTQFCRKFDRYNFMTKAIKVLDQEGTVVIHTGWDYKYNTVKSEIQEVTMDENGEEVIITREIENQETIVNQPTAKVCRNSDIYIDPTCQDNLDDAQFVIYRYETDLSTLKQDKRYSNLEKLGKSTLSDPVSDVTYDNPDDTDFQFEDEPRKKLIVYEYWGNYDIEGKGIVTPIVCSWIDNVVVRLTENPYPDKKPPFLIVPFNSKPFKIYGEANAELIGDNQKIKTAITRGIIDNMTKSNNGQVGIKKGELDDINRKRYLSGRSFLFNQSPHNLWQGSYNQIPNSVFDMIAIQNNEIESLTGVKSFSGGINGNSLGQTATGARGAMDAASVRRINIVRNIAENLVKPLMRKWMAYNSMFLSDKEIIRITNEEFVEVFRDDLEGKIDISIEISTAEDNAAKAQELSFMLQTIGPNEDPKIRRIIMASIMDLMRMPDLAKELREHKDEPDPLMVKAQELEIQKLELENKRIESEINDNNAKAEENRASLELMRAKTATEWAKAKQTASITDLKDLEFLKKDEGFDQLEKAELEEIKQAAKMKLEELKHQQNLEQMAFQRNAGDKDIGVVQ